MSEDKLKCHRCGGVINEKAIKQSSLSSGCILIEIACIKCEAIVYVTTMGTGTLTDFYKKVAPMDLTAMSEPPDYYKQMMLSFNLYWEGFNDGKKHKRFINYSPKGDPIVRDDGFEEWFDRHFDEEFCNFKEPAEKNSKEDKPVGEMNHESDSIPYDTRGHWLMNQLEPPSGEEHQQSKPIYPAGKIDLTKVFDAKCFLGEIKEVLERKFDFKPSKIEFKLDDEGIKMLIKALKDLKINNKQRKL